MGEANKCYIFEQFEKVIKNNKYFRKVQILLYLFLFILNFNIKKPGKRDNFFNN